MTYGMEMHDSQILEVGLNPDGEGFVLFHAVVYQSEGQVFEDAQRSGWQDVRFDFEGMRIEGEIREPEVWVLDGELWVNEQRYENTFSLPARHSGKICLTMYLADDYRKVDIHATSMTSSFVSEFKLEAYWDEMGNVTHA
jgi:hypothetical protein